MDQASSSFRCPTCPKVFFTRTDCNRHLKKHKKAFECAICPHRSGLKSDADRHRRSHQWILSKHKRSYKCLVPGCKYRGAIRQDHLLRHMKREHRSGDMKYSENELRAYYNKAKSTRESSQIRVQEKNLELLEAAHQGDVEKAQDAIDGGADVSTRDEEGRTAAHIAIDRGHTSVLKMVIQKGINPHHVLSHALERRRENSELVKTILDAGVEIDTEEIYCATSFGITLLTRSPLTFASMTGQAAVAQILLDHGAKTDDPSRTEGLFILGHVDVVRILIAHELNHNTNHRYGYFGATLLHLVAVNHAQLVAELIQRGFDINAKDCDKKTPLSYALGRYALGGYAISRWREGGSANEEAARHLLEAGAEISTEDLAFMPPTLRAKYVDRQVGDYMLQREENIGSLST